MTINAALFSLPRARSGEKGEIGEKTERFQRVSVVAALNKRATILGVVRQRRRMNFHWRPGG